MRRKSKKTQERPKLVFLAHEACRNCQSGWARVWTNGRRRCLSCGRKRPRRRGRAVVQVPMPKGAEATPAVGAP